VPHSATVLAGAGAVTAEVTATTLAEAHVTDQIVQSLKLQWMKGGGEATIELNPNGLGKVQVQVRVEHGAVSASVQAETPVVREFVASRRDELVQNLSQQGLRLDKLVVAETPKEQPARDGARDPRQAHREPARQRRDDRGAETDTFELNTPQENV
jgi:flagellar hook-length control protein FliK